MDTHTSLPVKLSLSNVRPIAYRILSKKYGLNIQTDSLEVLTNFIGQKFGVDWKSPQCQKLIEELGKLWKIQDRGNFIDGPGLTQVINELVSKFDQNAGNAALSEKIEKTAEEVRDNYGGELDWKSHFKFVFPSEQPKYAFDKNRKQFTLVNDRSDAFSSFLNSSLDLYKNRYYQTLNRVNRNDIFQDSSQPSILSITSNQSNISQSYKITQIKNLLGRNGSRFVLFGLLSTNENGDFTLEDSTDRIVLNLSQAYKNEGSFYCSGMFLIIEGIYSASGAAISRANTMGGCFHVSNIGHPLAERRDLSIENYGDLDFLGVHKDFISSETPMSIVKIPKSFKKKINQLEKTLTENRLFFLGAECFLEDSRTLMAIKKFLGHIENLLIEEENVPLAIVFVGSFTSISITDTNGGVNAISSTEMYKNGFDSLATLLSEFPNIIKNVKIVLIPGKNDPWQSSYSLGCSVKNTLPQRPIPRMFTNRLERILPKGNLICGWNPTRISYLSQEIVLFTDTLNTRLKRNDILFEADIEHEKKKLEEEEKKDGMIHADEVDTSSSHIPPKVHKARKIVKTMLDQGTLMPFSKYLVSVDPRYNFSLRIDPLPSIIVFFDPSFPDFDVSYNGTRVLNVGKLILPGRKLSYLEYNPSSKKAVHKTIHF